MTPKIFLCGKRLKLGLFGKGSPKIDTISYKMLYPQGNLAPLIFDTSVQGLCVSIQDGSFVTLWQSQQTFLVQQTVSL